jgi:hypothetical protein
MTEQLQVPGTDASALQPQPGPGDGLITIEPRRGGGHSQRLILVEPVLLDEQMVLDLSDTRCLLPDVTGDRLHIRLITADALIELVG